MSWLIGAYIREMSSILSSGKIHRDDYNNALLIQKCIEDINNQGLLSEAERDIIVAVYEGFNFTEISRLLKIDRQTVSQIFENVTDRIAYVLGNEFTDAAFLDRIVTTYGIEGVDVADMFKRGVIKKIDEGTWN